MANAFCVLVRADMFPQTMLVQVLQLTPDQINALDPSQQASVKQLVSVAVWAVRREVNC